MIDTDPEEELHNAKVKNSWKPPKKCWGEDRIRQNRPLCEDYLYLDKEQTKFKREEDLVSK